jgi:hypothetical protein
MTFPQTAHAFNPDDPRERASDFQGFPNPTLLEAAIIPIPKITRLVLWYRCMIQQMCVMSPDWGSIINWRQTQRLSKMGHFEIGSWEY